MTAQSHARSAARRFGWLVAIGLASTALLWPSSTVAAPLPGAIWTSLANGQTVNANHYDAKTDVYLNGGPQNCTGGGLPDGLYYFQVTDPSGATLLSSDALSARMVEVSGGVIVGAGGTGTHDEGSGACNGGTPVQLFPYDDTPNQGGEYKAWLSPEATVEGCDGFSAGSTTFNFKDCGESKTDNFKVGAVATATPTVAPTSTPTVAPTSTPTEAPTSTPTEAPTSTPTEAPTSTPTGSVLPTQTTNPTDPSTATPTGAVSGATATPARTLPTTDTIGGSAGPLNDGWRIVLLGLAGVLAAALLLTPATAVVRKDDADR